MNVMETGFRIKQAIGLTGLSVKEFCERSRRSRVTTALWIAGRGGIIKESSFDELCYDLKQFQVICNKEWLISGRGCPPTLYSSDDSQKQNEILSDLPSHFRYDFSILKSILLQFTSDHYQDYIDSKYYAISVNTDFSSLKKNKMIHLRLDTGEFCGLFEGFCKNSQMLILETLENKLHCFPAADIQYIGEIVFFINKK